MFGIGASGVEVFLVSSREASGLMDGLEFCPPARVEDS